MIIKVYSIFDFNLYLVTLPNVLALFSWPLFLFLCLFYLSVHLLFLPSSFQHRLPPNFICFVYIFSFQTVQTTMTRLELDWITFLSNLNICSLNWAVEIDWCTRLLRDKLPRFIDELSLTVFHNIEAAFTHVKMKNIFNIFCLLKNHNWL